MFKKSYPEALTSYDFLKTLAVLLMIVDHIGYYFFPGVTTLRILGRFCVPVWFFLVGYAQSRDFRIDWMIGCVVLVVASLFTQGYVLPLNIIGSMIIVRLVIDKLAFVVFMDMQLVLYTTFLAALLYMPSSNIFEYGTLGLLLSLSGYVARHPSEEKGKKERYLVFLIAVFILFFCFQRRVAQISLYEEIFLAAGSFATMVGLQYFRPHSFVMLTEKMPHWLVFFLQLTGRRTMEIYVIHLVFFKLLAVCFDMPGFGGQAWALFYQ